MPATEFFDRHKDEIEEALAPRLTWAMLQEYAAPKLATARKWLLVFDPSGVWQKLDIPIIEWFDRRDSMCKELETFADRDARSPVSSLRTTADAGMCVTSSTMISPQSEPAISDDHSRPSRRLLAPLI